jgi:hypothetical protein
MFLILQLNLNDLKLDDYFDLYDVQVLIKYVNILIFYRLFKVECNLHPFF